MLLVLLSISALAADAPVITVEQKLAIREAQLAVANNRAEIAEIESRLKDLYQKRPAFQKAFDDARAKVTPEGWNLQPDMTLVRCKFVEEPGCGKKDVAK